MRPSACWGVRLDQLAAHADTNTNMQIWAHTVFPTCGSGQKHVMRLLCLSLNPAKKISQPESCFMCLWHVRWLPLSSQWNVSTVPFNEGAPCLPSFKKFYEKNNNYVKLKILAWLTLYPLNNPLRQEQLEIDLTLSCGKPCFSPSIYTSLNRFKYRCHSPQNLHSKNLSSCFRHL